MLTKEFAFRRTWLTEKWLRATRQNINYEFFLERSKNIFLVTENISGMEIVFQPDFDCPNLNAASG